MQDKFTEEEKLDEDGGTVCPKCKDTSRLSKSLQIWRNPPVLVLQLKRFQFDRHTRRKLNTKVDFPIDGLDIRPYICSGRLVETDTSSNSSNTTLFPPVKKVVQSEELTVDFLSRNHSVSSCTIYDLYSVIHHVGALGGGHYVNTVRVGSDDWYCLNDNLVTKVDNPSQDISCNSSAYLLFYIRRDIKELTSSHPVDSLQDMLMTQINIMPSNDNDNEQDTEEIINSNEKKVVEVEEKRVNEEKEEVPTSSGNSCPVS